MATKEYYKQQAKKLTIEQLREAYVRCNINEDYQKQQNEELHEMISRIRNIIK